MKIALFTDGIHPYVVGGMQRHSYYLAKYFSLKGVQVDLYHTTFRGEKTNDFKLLHCFSDAEKQRIRSVSIDFPEFSSGPGHYLRESYVYSCRVYEAFRVAPPVDFVYAKGFTGWKFIEEKIKGNEKNKIGVNFHGYEMFQKSPSVRSKLEQVFLLRKPVLYNARNADFVFSYGGKITELISRLCSGKNKILEIPSGIERSWITEAPRYPEKRRKFVFLGRYERRKGIEELNASLQELIRKNDFEFHFVGNILERKRVISDKIFYHGEITDSIQLRELLRSCDVLVCPSHSEGMPNVILEAMASGLAIIASDVGAIDLMVSKENGWLLEESSKSKISEAISKAIHFPDKELMKLKETSIKKVREEFVWDRIIDTTINAIRKCL